MRTEPGAAASPRVSVFCTVRNGERTLGETLESVAAQSFRDWELLVVDDGSSDGSRRIAESLERRDPRIRVIPTRGVGRARALNLALDAARGPLVANVDADDPSHPRRLELQLAALEAQPEFSVVTTRHVVLLADEAPKWAALDTPAPALIDVTTRLRRGNPVNHSSVLMRRRDLLSVGGYADVRQRQVDYDLFVRLAARGFRIGLLPLELSSRRLHPGQSFEARSRLRYLASSLGVQARAIQALPGPSWHWLLLPARFAYGLLPRALRSRVRRVQRGHFQGGRSATHAG